MRIVLQGEFRESFWSVIAIVPIFGSIGRVGGRFDKTQGVANALGKGADLGKGAAKGGAGKASKVTKSRVTESIGGGKFTRKIEVRPGKGPGQTRAEYVRIKNADGKTIRTYKDSYDRANKWQGRKPLRGGPEGRPPGGGQ